MCSAPKPRAPTPSAPPPMYVPEAQDDNARRKRNRERERAAAAFGRESTILGGFGGPVGAPAAGATAQAKTLLGG